MLPNGDATLVLFRVRQIMTTASTFARLEVKIPTLPWDPGPSEATGQRPTKHFLMMFQIQTEVKKVEEKYSENGRYNFHIFKSYAVTATKL